MPPERRRLIALLGLLGVLAILVGFRLWPETDAPGSTVSVGRPAGAVSRGAGPSSVAAPDVHLRALSVTRSGPETAPRRDLFRFAPKPQPSRAVARVEPVVVIAPPPVGPPPAPALAPIGLRFIGLVEAQDHAQKIAILSDGRGIYQGREGDIIEGRYRILRIGVESVEMAYLDGRGRQTIRLSGS